MVKIEKYHGTGNDFVVVDAGENVPDKRQFARELCDRESGLSHPEGRRSGADGVLFLAPDAGATPPRVEMTLVQPDGSTAAMCGNGARCAADWAARFVRNRRDDPAAEELVVDTPAGTRRATVHGDGDVTVEMGVPAFDPAEVPVRGDEPLVEREVAGQTVTVVNTGVPHAVAFVDDVSDVAVEDVAPDVRYADAFPEGANVTFASGRDDGGFDQRTYERGVESETDACGTGAVAVAAVAARLGMAGHGEEMPVHPPGGRLVVTVGEDGSTLTGPAVREFADEVPASPAVDATGD